jgi:hypothetical protein
VIVTWTVGDTEIRLEGDVDEVVRAHQLLAEEQARGDGCDMRVSITDYERERHARITAEDALDAERRAKRITAADREVLGRVAAALQARICSAQGEASSTIAADLSRAFDGWFARQT